MAPRVYIILRAGIVVLLLTIILISRQTGCHFLRLRTNLGPFPINQVYVDERLVEVDLEEHVDEFAASDPPKQPIVLVVERVVLVK